MNLVTICDNILSPKSWQTEECTDIHAYLTSKFETWPNTAHIYHDKVAKDHDVTPYDEATIERLGKLQGHFYVVIMPGIPIAILIPLIISVALAAVAIGLSFIVKPSANVSYANNNNSQLSQRSNTQRTGERIPDIVGTVRSVPDLIGLPYRVFQNNQEVEYSYMCIGRGFYTVRDVRDDLTPINSIPGTSVEVYKPFTSPNSGDQPQLRIGSSIRTKVVNIQGINSVTGQTLLAPNQPGYDWVGPFIVEVATLTEVWFNFVAEQGLYQVDQHGNQTAMSVVVQAGLTPVDGAGNPTAAEELFTVTLNGSGSQRQQIGSTLKARLAGPTAVAVRAIRLTPTIIADNTQVSDQIQWRESFGVSPVGQAHFGNVTTVQSVTFPNPIALSLKNRKLNMLVTRNIPVYDEDSGTYSTVLFPTNNAADILAFLATDPLIGARQFAEIDSYGMHHALDESFDYFGTSLCGEFCYAFTDANVSFEEIAQDIATAVFCVAFRRGNVISLLFEKKTTDSTILFNHRNKVPRTETRTFNFGFLNDNDGITLDYIDPNAPNYPFVDSTVTLYYPPDQSATNPKKVTSIGIRNNVQAWIYGWRLYCKLLYQNVTTKFEATQEASVCTRMERILVADNTRPDTQDGEVIAQDGLNLTLSQPIDIQPDLTYVIYLQHYDGTMESIDISAGLEDNQVVLGTAPALPCVTADELFAKTTYVIVYTE